MSEEVKLLEELRPIGDGCYASNMGRIIGRRGKELRPYITPYGYALYNLGDKGGRPHRGSGHRLVALAFCDNPQPLLYTEADHINGVKLDNRAANLRWVDHRTNIRAIYELRERLGLPKQSPAEEERTKKMLVRSVAKRSKPTRVQGEVFSSLSEAARHLSINPGSLLYAIKKGHYKGVPVAYA